MLRSAGGCLLQHLITALIGSLCLVGRDHAEFHARQPIRETPLASVPCHPLPLVLSAFLADTALHVGGISSVLEVDSPGSSQSGFQRCRPSLGGLGHSPHLV